MLKWSWDLLLPYLLLFSPLISPLFLDSNTSRNRAEQLVFAWQSHCLLSHLPMVLDTVMSAYSMNTHIRKQLRHQECRAVAAVLKGSHITIPHSVGTPNCQWHIEKTAAVLMFVYAETTCRSYIHLASQGTKGLKNGYLVMHRLNFPWRWVFKNQEVYKPCIPCSCHFPLFPLWPWCAYCALVVGTANQNGLFCHFQLENISTCW